MYIGSIIPRSIHGAVTAHYYEGGYYPLTHSLYAIVHAIAGDAPLTFHLLQALLFALTVALVPRALSAFGVSPLAMQWRLYSFELVDTPPV